MSFEFIVAEHISQRDAGRVREETARNYFAEKYWRDFIPSALFVMDGGTPDREISIRHARVDRFWAEMTQVFDGELPEFLKEEKKKSDLDKEKAVALGTLQEYDSLSTCDLPPFCSAQGFDTIIKRDAKGEKYPRNYDLNRFTFTSELLGEGAFAHVYRVLQEDGTDCVLKLSRHELLHPRWQRTWYRGTGHQAIRNVQHRFADIQSIPSFAQPLVVCANKGWYIAELLEGRSVADMMEKEPLDEPVKGKVIVAFADMLQSVHDKGLVFVDPNLGAPIVSNDAVRFCDYDFMCRPEETSGPRGLAFKVGPRFYPSKEYHLDEKRGPLAERESLALLVDHLLVGTPWIDGTEAYAVHAEFARSNNRRYALSREQLLPPQLRQVVPRLINYPRDESITLGDIADAAKQDYSL